jgi:glycosyltransferase involved in cell wall biosynthesis
LTNKIDDIINVARQLQLKAINVHIYILGNGPLKSFYIEEAKSLKNITFLDSISSQDVAQFLSNFDLLMLTWSDLPIYRFGVSPNKVIDYMKSGRPILMSYSGYPSLYELEKYCFLTEAENTEAITSKIIEIKSKSKIELDLMGKKAREILHKYHNYDILSDKYIDIMNNF